MTESCGHVLEDTSIPVSYFSTRHSVSSTPNPKGLAACSLPKGHDGQHYARKDTFEMTEHYRWNDSRSHTVTPELRMEKLEGQFDSNGEQIYRWPPKCPTCGR